MPTIDRRHLAWIKRDKNKGYMDLRGEGAFRDYIYQYKTQNQQLILENTCCRVMREPGLQPCVSVGLSVSRNRFAGYNEERKISIHRLPPKASLQLHRLKVLYSMKQHGRQRYCWRADFLIGSAVTGYGVSRGISTRTGEKWDSGRTSLVTVVTN